MRFSVLSAAALMASCALYQSKDDEPDRSDDSQDERDYRIVADLLPAQTSDIDILFVADDSGSMSAKQRVLALTGIPALTSGLRADPSQRLDLQVGFVSTSIGAGLYRPHPRAHV